MGSPLNPMMLKIVSGKHNEINKKIFILQFLKIICKNKKVIK